MTVCSGSQRLREATTRGLSCVNKGIFSPDGHSLLTFTDGCGYIQLWDMFTGNA